MQAISNGTLESLKSITAHKGDGSVVLGSEALAMPLPIEIIAPKAYRVETDRQRGIQNDLMIRVDRQALEVRNHAANAGDRVEVKRSRLGQVAESFEVTEVQEVAGGEILELVLQVRDDAEGEA